MVTSVPPSAGALPSPIGWLLLWCLCAWPGGQARAEHVTSDPPMGAAVGVLPDAPADTPEAVVARVLAHEDFGGTRTVTRWVSKTPRQAFDLDMRRPAESQRPAERGQVLAAGLEGALWLSFGAVLAALAVALLRNKGGLVIAGHAAPPPLPESPGSGRHQPTEPSGQALVAEARRRWAEGDEAGALGLLYNGAVASLTRQGLPIAEGATEGECLRVVQRQDTPERSRFFRALTRCWQEGAYAHRPVPEARVRLLFDGWIGHFQVDE